MKVVSKVHEGTRDMLNIHPEVLTMVVGVREGWLTTEGRTRSWWTQSVAGCHIKQPGGEGEAPEGFPL